MPSSSPATPLPRYAPRPPFLAYPAQWVHSWGYIWLTPYGNALITQVTSPTATVEAVHGIHDCFDELDSRGVAERLPRLVIVHDWRGFRSVAPGTRQAWAKRMANRGEALREAQAYVALDANPVLRMSLQAANLTIQVALGRRIANFVASLNEPIEQYAIRAPSPTFKDEFLSGRGVRSGS